jgi:hypothetical protein
MVMDNIDGIREVENWEFVTYSISAVPELKSIGPGIS